MRKGLLYVAHGHSTTYQAPSYNAPYGAYPMQIASRIRKTYGIPVNCTIKGVAGSNTNILVNTFNYVNGFPEADLITLDWGINDKNIPISIPTFQSNLKVLIDFHRRGNPDVKAILCASNTQTSASAETDLAPYRTAMDTIAASYSSGVYVCHFENGWTVAQGATYSGDGIHPNDAGHTKCADLLEAVLTATCASYFNSFK